MGVPLESALRDQLVDRHRRIETVLRQVGEADDLLRLLLEVDSALKRMDGHHYGNCDVCRESVDEWFLRQLFICGNYRLLCKRYLSLMAYVIT